MPSSWAPKGGLDSAAFRTNRLYRPLDQLTCWNATRWATQEVIRLPPSPQPGPPRQIRQIAGTDSVLLGPVRPHISRNILSPCMDNWHIST